MKWLSASIVLCVIASIYGQDFTTVGKFTGRLSANNGTVVDCAAHLVHENWLVTSAHCLEAINSMAVTIGTTVLRAVKAFVNDNYLSAYRDADVALVKIIDGVSFNETVTKTKILNCTASPAANAVVQVLSLNGTFRNATVMSDYYCQWKTYLLYTHVVCLNEVPLLAPYESIWMSGQLYGISTLTPGVFTRLCTYDQMLAGAITA
ncbi:unnamed protein product [Diamesa hyperborea]